MDDPSTKFEMSAKDKIAAEAAVSKVHKAFDSDDSVSHITKDALYALLSKDEQEVVEWVYTLDPSKYGFRGPHYGIEPVPHNLVRVEARPYYAKGVERFTETHYIPEPVYEAYDIMASNLEAEIGRPLLIDSSYRSDAYQAIVFLWILKIHDFDIFKTARQVAVPGYSEHGTPSRLALDFVTIDGIPNDETGEIDFDKTPEYDWLRRNAGSYGFSLSYPRDNPYGVMFEPWHWRFDPNSQ